MSTALPLSWAYTPTTEPVIEKITLPLSEASWLYAVDLPFSISALSFLQHIPHRWVLRGVPPRLASMVRSGGGYATRIAGEWVLNADYDYKRYASLRALVNRGIRKTEVAEITAMMAMQQYAAIKGQSTRSRKPPLKYLYRTDIDTCQRFFVARIADKPVALVSLTQNAKDKWHLEQMIRDMSAPIGTLEALIIRVFKRLDGDALSLGESPFYPNKYLSGSVEWVARIGRAHRSVFNAKGLYSFKAKFRADLKPLYLCSNEPINTQTVADLYLASGMPSQIIAKILNRFR